MAVKYGNTAEGRPSASFATIQGRGTNYIKGNADIESLETVDVTFNETARISAEERDKIVPENIVDGVTILGVTGSASGGGTTVIANPTLTGEEDDLVGLQVGSTKYRVSGLTEDEYVLISGTSSGPDLPPSGGETYEVDFTLESTDPMTYYIEHDGYDIYFLDFEEILSGITYSSIPYTGPVVICNYESNVYTYFLAEDYSAYDEEWQAECNGKIFHFYCSEQNMEMLWYSLNNPNDRNFPYLRNVECRPYAGEGGSYEILGSNSQPVDIEDFIELCMSVVRGQASSTVISLYYNPEGLLDASNLYYKLDKYTTQNGVESLVFASSKKELVLTLHGPDETPVPSLDSSVDFYLTVDSDEGVITDIVYNQDHITTDDFINFMLSACAFGCEPCWNIIIDNVTYTLNYIGFDDNWCANFINIDTGTAYTIQFWGQDDGQILIDGIYSWNFSPGEEVLPPTPAEVIFEISASLVSTNPYEFNWEINGESVSDYEVINGMLYDLGRWGRESGYEGYITLVYNDVTYLYYSCTYDANNEYYKFYNAQNNAILTITNTWMDDSESGNWYPQITGFDIVELSQDPYISDVQIEEIGSGSTGSTGPYLWSSYDLKKGQWDYKNFDFDAFLALLEKKFPYVLDWQFGGAGIVYLKLAVPGYATDFENPFFAFLGFDPYFSQIEGCVPDDTDSYGRMGSNAQDLIILSNYGSYVAPHWGDTIRSFCENNMEALRNYMSSNFYANLWYNRELVPMLGYIDLIANNYGNGGCEIYSLTKEDIDAIFV